MLENAENLTFFHFSRYFAIFFTIFTIFHSFSLRKPPFCFLEIMELTKHGLVLPGESISKYTSASVFQTTEILYGPGLNGASVTRPGLLHSNVTAEGNFIFWIETHTKRYHDPVPGDVVLGTVVTRLSEFFRVDIGTAELGMLNMLAFQGATKRSKPDIYPGGFAEMS